MRRATGSALPASGLLGIAAPVAGLTRRIEPLRSTGSPGFRSKLCERSGATFVVGVIASVVVPAGVDDEEVGSVATADVQRAVRPERQVADRMARELLAPAVEEIQLGARHRLVERGVGCQPDEAAADHAAEGRRARRIRAGVVPDRRSPSDRRVEGKERPEVRMCRAEVGVEHDREQPAIPVVVDLGPQIGERRRSRVREARVLQDQPALLGNEHLAVGREAHLGGVGQAPDHGGLLEVRRHVGQRVRDQAEHEHAQPSKYPLATQPHCPSCTCTPASAPEGTAS